MIREYVQPTLDEAAFNCPHCGIYSQQHWSKLYSRGLLSRDFSFSFELLDGFSVALCGVCRRHSLWNRDQLVYPHTGAAPPPNPDLPDDIRTDYEEARQICGRSPRGAAALLRLAVQKLCRHLGQPGKDLNLDIGALTREGLPTVVAQALDSVRVVGNHAVHPGQINIDDNPAITAALFELVNLVAEKTITERRKVDEIFHLLPEGAREAIKKRDLKT